MFCYDVCFFTRRKKNPFSLSPLIRDRSFKHSVKAAAAAAAGNSSSPHLLYLNLLLLLLSLCVCVRERERSDRLANSLLIRR